jgi:hypothetical protein
MSMLKLLKQELSKYRKRKLTQLNQSVQEHFDPGLSQFHINSKPVDIPYPQQMYLQNPPKDYRPNIHLSAVDWGQYRIQSEGEPIHFSQAPQGRIGNTNSNIPALLHPTVNDDLTLTEQHLMNVGLRLRPHEETIQMNLSEILSLTQGVRGNINSMDTEQPQVIPNLEEMISALNILKDTLPSDHPDVVNLSNAVQIMSGQGIFNPDKNVGITQADPIASYQIEQQIQSMQDYGQPLNPQAENVMPQETLSEKPFQDISPLEQIVQQEFAAISSPMNAEMPDPMAAVHATMNEINQAMEQAMQIPQPPQEDPFMQYGMLFNQQMQYMANPFMMQGMGPM